MLLSTVNIFFQSSQDRQLHYNTVPRQDSHEQFTVFKIFAGY